MRLKGRCGIIMWLTSVLFLASTIFFVSQKGVFDSLGGYWALVIIFGLSTAFVFSFMVRNYVVVSDREIKICLGFTTTILEIASIVSMKKVTNVVASSAASAKRIEIVFIKDNLERNIYISLKDNDKFMRMVCEYNENVKVHDKAKTCN